MANKTLLPLNDNTIQLDALKDVDGNFDNTSTVTATLFDASGVEIAGETWPITLPYVAGSDGRYRGVFRDTIVISPGDRVRGVIIADSGTDKRAEFECDYLVQRRKC